MKRIQRLGFGVIPKTANEVGQLPFGTAPEETAARRRAHRCSVVRCLNPCERPSWAAGAAFVWMVFFAVVHVYWVLGGAVGLPPGMILRDNSGLFIAGLIAIPLCVIGAGLALDLRHSKEGMLPRRPLLVAGWLTSAIMLVHSLPAIVELVVLAVRGDLFELSQLERFSLWLYEPFWFLGGALFAVATLRYQRLRPAQGDR